jgi:glycerol-3-phosphate dehydrogenase
VLRDVDHLTRRTFDVLVVGGGIYGLTIACDAASRGLEVALVDRGDFGSGASFNHLRTIHGGLRYLQALDLGRARESIRERRALARIAPHALGLLPFALPLSRSLAHGRLAMRAGLLVDRALGRDRNDGVPARLRLPGGRVVSREEALARFPALARPGLTGAAVWHDYVTMEPDRLTLAWALAASERGATLANYVEATALVSDGGRVIGARAVDRATAGGREVEIAARLTVCAAGHRTGPLARTMGIRFDLPLLKALNLVTRREAGDAALGARSPSGRHLFLVPWRGRALFGTWESPGACQADEEGVGEGEVASFVDELNLTFPTLGLGLGEVTLVHRGLVPASVGSGGRVALRRHEQVRDHGNEGADGLISVSGTKYTTARAVAERVVDRLLATLRRPAVPSRTGVDPLPGGDMADPGSVVSTAGGEATGLVATDTLQHLAQAYGTRHVEVLALAATRPDWLARICQQSPVIAGQLVWGARHEMAQTLVDVVVRRTPLGALGHPGEAAAERAAQMVGAELGWSDDRRRTELRLLREFYRPL